LHLHSVAIVGRPNVGKSSLLNRIIRRRVSIVEPTAGVTRDRVVVAVSHGGRAFDLVDTGGIGLVDETLLKEQVEDQIRKALESAAVLIFVVDAKEGMTPGDREVADRIRRLEKPIVLVANKVEGRPDEYGAAEAHGLGLGEPLLVSAIEGFGIEDLLDSVVRALPEACEAEDQEQLQFPALRIAVVGKRNSGKSTLVNRWASDERVIVSELPGTTRDSVDVRFEVDGRVFVAVDTAGLRRKHSVENAIEFFSLARAEEAVRRADVVLLLFDMREVISQVDKSLSRLVSDESKPCLIAGNFLDLATNTSRERWEQYIRQQLKGLSYAPVIFLSAKEGTNARETLARLDDLANQASIQVPTRQLNEALDAARRRQSPHSRGKTPKLFYGTQVGVLPPTVLLFVNEPRLFRGQYERYLQNELRKRLPWKNVPVRIVYRQRQRAEAGAGRPDVEAPEMPDAGASADTGLPEDG
jgi:GTP-binding protein